MVNYWVNQVDDGMDSFIHSSIVIFFIELFVSVSPEKEQIFHIVSHIIFFDVAHNVIQFELLRAYFLCHAQSSISKECMVGTYVPYHRRSFAVFPCLNHLCIIVLLFFKKG